MKLNNILDKARLAACAVACLVGMSSCEDWLTTLPTNAIVEENFWEDKNDLLAVVSSSYCEMRNLVDKYVTFGETRSDNFTLRDTKSGELYNLDNANLLPTDGIYKWDVFYKVNNYCNKVLSHGDIIIERDPSFTQGDWDPIRAEMITLRSLNYFYLTRIYQNVPIITYSYDDDSHDFNVPQNTQLEVFTQIINDMEEIKDLAMEKYADNLANKGRVTRKFTYALLADVLMWRGAYYEGHGNNSAAIADYKRCVQVCDALTSYAMRKKKESMNAGATITHMDGSVSSDVIVSDLLISNASGGRGNGSYASIFGDMNSEESIFELQFDDDNKCSVMHSKWGFGGESYTSLYKAASVMQTLPGDNQLPDSPTEGIWGSTDLRRWESLRYQDKKDATTTGDNSLNFNKYVSRQVLPDQATRKNNNASTIKVEYKDDRTSASSSNWIIYRMSEIFLIRAEATSRLFQLEGDATYQDETVEYVGYVSDRSNPECAAKFKTLVAGGSLSYPTGDDLTKLVMRERQREFVCEGKRWFDLLRMAIRANSTADALTLLLTKFANTSAVKAKLNSLESFYCPIHQDEVELNDKLVQNSIWVKQEDSYKRN